MDDDDLGDFFSEINQLEVPQEKSEECAENASENNWEEPAFKIAATEKTVSTAPVSTAPALTKPTVVAAKAPEIIKSIPVYTYEAPVEYSVFENSAAYGMPSSNDYQQPPQILASSLPSAYGQSAMGSSFSFSTTTTSYTPAPPPVPRQQKEFVRKAGGEVWKDDTLNEWPENDFRIFVGDLGKETTTEMLTKHFAVYKSFAKAKVIRSKVESRARGYGFVSFLDPMDCAKAIREMNGKYLGTRPMKITKSDWKARDIKEVAKKDKKKRKLQESLGLC